jgi:3',5'-cyclic AMP phosphodiesterase CpdA
VKTIVHISDLHFNWINEPAVSAAVQAIQAIQPDILAVSGDLTQHARRREFQAAVDFLRKLPGRPIVVPGNHDMAFLNPWRRVRQRLRLFREMVTQEVEPFYSDEEITVLGLNTARVTHLRNGRIRLWQIRHIEEKMRDAAQDTIRVLVTHHPFDLPAIYPDREIVRSGRQFIPRILKNVDVLLAGHMHISHAGPTALRYQIEGQSAIFVQAGTALSTRGRGETNSFQVLRAAGGSLETTQYAFDGTAFHPEAAKVFRREQGTWTAETPTSGIATS